MTRRWRRGSGCENSNPDAPHQKPQPHRSRSVENARAGMKVAVNEPLDEEGVFTA